MVYNGDLESHLAELVPVLLKYTACQRKTVSICNLNDSYGKFCVLTISRVLDYRCTTVFTLPSAVIPVVRYYGKMDTAVATTSRSSDPID